MNDSKNRDTLLIGGLKVTFKAIQSGLFGFAIFFTVLLLSKYLSSAIGNLDSFTVDLSDVLLSFIGFILTFLISFLGQISPKGKTSNFKERLH